jgi:predicted RNase H-like HicB family nuclease
MTEIEFFVLELPEGGYVARSACGCIVTQADTIEELRGSVREASECHCAGAEPPKTLRLKFCRLLREETVCL